MLLDIVIFHAHSPQQAQDIFKYTCNIRVNNQGTVHSLYLL